MGIFINALNPLWKEMLEECTYDFYHIPEYVSIEAQMLKGEAIAYYHEADNCKILIPLVKRKIPCLQTNQNDWYDACSPYGYAGILCNQEFDIDAMDDIVEKFQQDAREEGLVTTMIRLHPYYNNALFRETSAITQVVRGYTVWIDLRKDMDKLFSSFSRNHQQNIKQLQQRQFTVVKGNWKHYEAFVDIYYQTMDRNQASDYYYFDQHYFLMLRAVLGDSIELLTVQDSEGVICAGGIFTCFHGIIQCHLVATKQEYLNVSPVKLIFYEAAKWGKERECKWLHIGGGRRVIDDSLYHFKQGFSPLKRKFCTLQIVHDPVKYQNLMQTREVVPQSNFFPLYRENNVLVPADRSTLVPLADRPQRIII